MQKVLLFETNGHFFIGEVCPFSSTLRMRCIWNLYLYMYKKHGCMVMFFLYLFILFVISHVTKLVMFCCALFMRIRHIRWMYMAFYVPLLKGS